jgi:AraC-like DNA-binding protein
VVAQQRIRAWRPPVPGVAEVFHAHFVDHAYPMHTHEAWTLLIVDDGGDRYALATHEHGTLPQAVTLLPPHIPHNGQSATPAGFRKRVAYLDSSVIPEHLIGLAVDRPLFPDPLLRDRIHRLHRALEHPGEEFEAEGRLALVAERLRDHLAHTVQDRGQAQDPTLARRLRELLDARFREGISLQQASEQLHAHPAHLVRVFSREFGMGPHQYLTGRRVDLARGLLLDGMSPALAATASGFYDQPHFTRQFKRVLGTTPGRYARSGGGAG